MMDMVDLFQFGIAQQGDGVEQIPDFLGGLMDGADHADVLVQRGFFAGKT